MTKHQIYDEIKLLAKENDWKICFLDSDDAGNNVIKVHNFKTDETLTVYKFSVNVIVDLLPPSISHDGNKIGFWLKEDINKNALYVINTDGSDLKKIITVANGHGVAWSHDDRKIAFSGSLTDKDLLEKNTSLYVVDIKDKEAKVIIKNQVGGIINQSWSSDDKNILYGYKGDIINYNFATKKMQKLASGDWFAWSPRGDWIAYIEEHKLNIINPVTLEKRTLVEAGRISAPIYWLPNGEYIVYGVFIGEHVEIGDPYIVRLSDKKSEPVAPGYLWILASWAKDNK